LILLVKLIESGNLPPERRSCITAEDQYDWMTGRRQGGESHTFALIEFCQNKIGGAVADMERAGTCLHPQRFKGKYQKRNGAGQLGHKMPKCFRRLAHDVVECAAAEEPEDRDSSQRAQNNSRWES